ncbi:hypothetical protein G6F31_014247 [Rhizopus arrhizus]|nr:hypothetical protein G6F31_014247 [Rhizopus arrhizus]
MPAQRQRGVVGDVDVHHPVIQLLAAAVAVGEVVPRLLRRHEAAAHGTAVVQRAARVEFTRAFLDLLPAIAPVRVQAGPDGSSLIVRR